MLKRRARQTFLPLLGGLLAWVFSLGPTPALALEQVSLRLLWAHQAQFAGFYLAQDLGLYEQAGLEVDLWPYNPVISPLDELASGGCDFATAWLSDAMQRRGRGQDLVHLAQLAQRSALMLVARKESGIATIQDLQGKRVGMWGEQFAIPPRALFKRLGLTVLEIPQSYTVSPLMQGAVDAATAMLYNEYHQYYQAGLDYEDLVVLDFAKLGLNFPEDGLYAAGPTWTYRPELCRRLAQATMEGWRRAMADPEAALEAVMRRIGKKHLGTRSTHQRWMLKTMSELVSAGVEPDQLGRLNERDMARVNRVLVEQGFLPRPVEAKGFISGAWGQP